MRLLCILLVSLSVLSSASCIRRAPEAKYRKLTGTCQGACDHYLSCKTQRGDRVTEQNHQECVFECADVFSGPETLLAFESLTCEGAIGFVEGAGRSRARRPTAAQHRVGPPVVAPQSTRPSQTGASHVSWMPRAGGAATEARTAPAGRHRVHYFAMHNRSVGDSGFASRAAAAPSRSGFPGPAFAPLRRTGPNFHWRDCRHRRRCRRRCRRRPRSRRRDRGGALRTARIRRCEFEFRSARRTAFRRRGEWSPPIRPWP